MSQKNARRFRFGLWGAKLLGHFTATVGVFAIFGLLFLTEPALHMLDVGLLDHQMSSQLWAEMGLIFGVSACFWAMMYLSVQYFREARKSRKKLALAKARGTIMTETLIVLPVFFLLTFGLSQMAINSMAGLLTTLATYQAARTVAVWAPEEGHDRSGAGTVSATVIEDKARVAAAGVIAPVAPSLATGIAGCDTNSTTLDNFLQSLTGAGVAPVTVPKFERWSFVDALDTGSFATRGWIKMKSAYCAVNVEYTDVITDPDNNDRSEFSTTVIYNHRSIMPLVGPIFATGAEGDNAPTGMNIAAIKRTYSLTQQVSPNPRLPKKGAIASLISGIGSLP